MGYWFYINRLRNIAFRPNPVPHKPLPIPKVIWFTPRERQILSHLRLARANKEIADAMEIAVGTVKSHISTLLSRLNCSDRSKLILWIFQHPDDMRVGYTQHPYLHPVDCVCGRPCEPMEPAA